MSDGHQNDMVWSSFVLDCEPWSANFMRVCSFLGSVMILYPSSFSLEGLIDGCGNCLLLSIITRSTQWAWESIRPHLVKSVQWWHSGSIWNRKLSGFTIMTDQWYKWLKPASFGGLENMLFPSVVSSWFQTTTLWTSNPSHWQMQQIAISKCLVHS